MHNSKLISLFKTFSKAEFKEFEKFVASPFHSRGRNLMPLYKYLKEFHPEFTNKKLDIEYAFKTIYPGKAYNMLVMRKLTSELEKMGEDYLVQINMRNNNFDYYKRLSDEFKSRKMIKLFETNILKATEEIRKIGINNDYFKKTFEIFLVKEEAYFKIGDHSKTIESLLAGSVYFILYSLMEITLQLRSIELIKHYTKHDMNELLVNVLFKNLEFDEILKFIKVNFPEYGSILEMQYYSLKISTGYKDDGLIEKVWELYIKNFKIISSDSKYSYYYFISGASSVVSQNNPDKYNPITFEIIKFGLKHKLYVPENENFMDPYFYRLGVNTGIDLKEYVWVKTFIDDYDIMLQPENRDNMRFYAYMLYYFYKGNFEKSLSNAGKIKFDLFQFKYDIRVITLMIYYELDYIEESISLLDSFKHFIIENKSVTDERKNIYLNFIRIYDMLLKCKTGEKGILIDRLKTDITNSDYMVRKEWFIKKIEELEINKKPVNK